MVGFVAMAVLIMAVTFVVAVFVNLIVELGIRAFTACAAWLERWFYDD